MKNDAPIDEKKQEQETPKSLLEELIREGARRLLQAAIEQKVTEYLERFRGSLDTARIFMQLDIGFGDVVVPLFEPMNYPTIPDLPAPQLHVYSRESTIAEKFEAMVGVS